MEDDLIIRQRDIKVRKKWSLNPDTRILPKKRSKREKDSVRKTIKDELDEFVSNQ